MLPKELRSRRLALGVSREELARRAGIEPSLLAAMENGDAPIPALIITTLEALEHPGTVNSTERPS